jgi:hypothetical protein
MNMAKLGPPDLDAVLRIEFGQRMAERCARGIRLKQEPLLAQDLLVTFLGRSAVAAMFQALAPGNEELER